MEREVIRAGDWSVPEMEEGTAPGSSAATQTWNSVHSGFAFTIQESANNNVPKIIINIIIRLYFKKGVVYSSNINITISL